MPKPASGCTHTCCIAENRGCPWTTGCSAGAREAEEPAPAGAGEGAQVVTTSNNTNGSLRRQRHTNMDMVRWGFGEELGTSMGARQHETERRTSTQRQYPSTYALQLKPRARACVRARPTSGTSSTCGSRCSRWCQGPQNHSRVELSHDDAGGGREKVPSGTVQLGGGSGGLCGTAWQNRHAACKHSACIQEGRYGGRGRELGAPSRATQSLRR
jgi:hypothetical protein